MTHATAVRLVPLRHANSFSYSISYIKKAEKTKKKKWKEHGSLNVFSLFFLFFLHFFDHYLFETNLCSACGFHLTQQMGPCRQPPFGQLAPHKLLVVCYFKSARVVQVCRNQVPNVVDHKKRHHLFFLCLF